MRRVAPSVLARERLQALLAGGAEPGVQHRFGVGGGGQSDGGAGAVGG
jgi:hypothetical protein